MFNDNFILYNSFLFFLLQKYFSVDDLGLHLARDQDNQREHTVFSQSQTVKAENIFFFRGVRGLAFWNVPNRKWSVKQS